MSLPPFREQLNHGVAIPAHPLALNANRKLDERRQRALTRYYLAAGAGGLAVGVHTTQFAIHDPKVGYYQPVLEWAVEEMKSSQAVRVAGVVGKTNQAVREATLARELGYHTGLLSLAAMNQADEDDLIDHCRAVAEALPLFGFYLQPAVGGMELPYSFWRRFAEIDNVVAIKIAPFDRERTFEVIRAVAESGRDDIALYTGNDDHIVLDLLTPFHINVDGHIVKRHFAGGLLGHWAVWTKKAVELLETCRSQEEVSETLAIRAAEVTDCNAAIFDVKNRFAGCIPGLLEVLRRQGLLEGTWCLDPNETLSPGQSDEIDRVYRAYPQLTDDDFVKEHLNEWLND